MKYTQNLTPGECPLPAGERGREGISVAQPFQYSYFTEGEKEEEHSP